MADLHNSGRRRTVRGDGRGIGDKSAAEYAQLKRAWLYRIATDRSLPALAAPLAIILTERFFSHDHGGVAFMSQSTLAEIIGVKRPAVSLAMIAMERRGLLIDLATGNRTKSYIIGGVGAQDGSAQKSAISESYPANMFAGANTSGAATCSPTRTGRKTVPDQQPVRLSEHVPVSPCEQDPVRLSEHNLRKNEHRESEHRESSLRSDSVSESEASLACATGSNSNSEPLKPATSIKAAPSHGRRKGSGKASDASGGAEAVQLSLPRVEAAPALQLVAPRAKLKRRASTSSRSAGHDPELAAAMRELRQLYPPGVNTPVSGQEEAWKSVKVAMRESHNMGNVYSDILDGVRRYAAYVASANPSLCYGPRNFVREGHWRKPWDTANAARSNGFARHSRAQSIDAANLATRDAIVKATSARTDDSGF